VPHAGRVTPREDAAVGRQGATDVGARGRAALGRAAQVLFDVVLPRSCAGCGREDVGLCAACRDVWRGPGARVEAAAPRLDRLDGTTPFPVWAVVPYAGGARSVVVAWKDRGRRDLHPVLRGAVAREAARRRSALAALPPDLALVVVPVPSTARAVRGRGADLVADLAATVAARLAVPCVPLLRVRHRKRDQVGLGARDRARNLRGALRVDPRAARATRRRAPGASRGSRGPAAAGPAVVAVLVDDVVTSGATLAACADALATAGVLVVAAICLAATPAPGAAARAFPLAPG